MRGAFPLALVAFLSLAGCTGNAAKTSTDSLQQSLEGVDVHAGATTGAIRGVVVDEAIRPIAAASIAYVGHNLTTDAQGRFAIEGLAPGTLFLQASAKGFLKVQTSAVVEAGKVADVRIALPADPTPVPFHDTLKFKGFIQASASIASYAVDLFANTTGVSTCPSCTLYFQNDPTVTTIVYEAVWTDSVPSPTGPQAFYYEVEDVDANHIESAFLPSPINVHLDAQQFWGNITHMQARLTGPAEWVESNQEYDLFLTLFHRAPAPTTWSFVKGDT